MKSKHPDAIQWSAMRGVMHYAEIRRKVKSLVESISEEFSEPSVKHHCPVEMVATDDDRILATISCPVGGGRLVLQWEAQDAELVGQLVVQRSIFNEFDQLSWEAVWAVSVPHYGVPYVDSKDGRIGLLPEHSFGQQYSTAVFTIALSMICAIATGPQFE